MKYNPSDYGLRTVYDMQKRAFRHINLNTVQRITAKGQHYDTSYDFEQVFSGVTNQIDFIPVRKELEQPSSLTFRRWGHFYAEFVSQIYHREIRWNEGIWNGGTRNCGIGGTRDPTYDPSGSGVAMLSRLWYNVDTLLVAGRIIHGYTGNDFYDRP